MTLRRPTARVAAVRRSRTAVAAGAAASVCTAWPPNWLRIAATAFIAGQSSWREVNRAKSEAAMTCIGTAWSIAASTVHRPSPESSA